MSTYLSANSFFYLQNTFSFIAVSRIPLRTNSLVARQESGLPWSSLVGAMESIEVLALPSSETCEGKAIALGVLFGSVDMSLTFWLWPCISRLPIHQVIFAGGLDPIAWHSISYLRSADIGWLLKLISTRSGRTANMQVRVCVWVCFYLYTLIFMVNLCV